MVSAAAVNVLIKEAAAANYDHTVNNRQQLICLVAETSRGIREQIN